MRWRAVSLIVLTAILAGAVPAAADFQEQVEALLAGLEERLENYRSELQSQGDAELLERQKAIQAQLDEEWEDYYAQLAEEGRTYAAWLQEEYGRQLLRLHLELLLVTMDEQEFKAKLEARATLQDTITRLRAEKEAELKARLEQHKQALDQRFTELSEKAQAEIEARLTEKYRTFKEDLLWAFEQTLRNSYANRQY